ncbi:MAG: histidine phosphatase family protein [Gammaproteobacteria bacterium]|jgi:phosphohistidine phosphatase SixA
MTSRRIVKLLPEAVLRAALLLLVLPFAATQAAAQSQLADAELVDALRGGGYNIYFRHVATEWSQSDRVEQHGDWLVCDPDRMRQLSAAGRADASAIGAAIRDLSIPVGEVLASPYCRTMETARLMDVGQVLASTEVMNLRSASYFGGREAIVAAARRLLSSSPPAGANRVIVAHGNVAREATPVYPGEGEGLVFEPSANGFRLVGRLTPADWQRLAANLD